MGSKQTTMQIFIAWGDEMLKQHPMKLLSFAEAIDKAAELLMMEKEQIIDAYANGSNDRLKNVIKDYYNETYGGNNE